MITPVLGNAGGMGRVAEEYATRLATRGHEVIVFSPVRPPLPRMGEGGGMRVTNPRFIFIRPLFRYGHGAWVPQLAGMLHDFDVVHFHYPFLGGVRAMLRGIKILKHENIKTQFVVSYHMDLIGSDIFHPFFRAYQKFVLPQLMRAVDKIIVSSLDYANQGDLKPFCDSATGKMREVPFGVDSDHFQPISNSRELANKEREFTTFLFVGKLDRAHYFKGVPILLRAFSEAHRRHPSTRLNLVGSGDFLEAYRREAHALSIDTAVTFCGSVSPEMLLEQYQNADCLVLSSVDRSEAFGLVLLEAQSCSVPVIASGLPGVRTTLEAEKTGLLVELGEVESLQNALEWMVTNPERRRVMGRAARTRIETYYTWDKIITQLETIYIGR